MPDEQAARALEIAGKLHELVEDIDKRLGAASEQGKRTKWLARAVLVIVVVTAVLFGLLFAALSGVQARACQAANDQRAAQVRLWDHVIAVSRAPAGETAAQRRARLAQVAAFRAYVASRFAPVGCTILPVTGAAPRGMPWPAGRAAGAWPAPPGSPPP